MRVLWFVQNALPAVRAELGIVDLGNQAGWVTNAALALAQREDIRLGAVWASPLVTRYREFTADGIDYFCIPTAGRLEAATRSLGAVPGVGNVWKLAMSGQRRHERRALSASAGIIERFKPELIHVHGTEGFFGRLGGCTRVPVVISLQGILSAYVRVYWGGVPWWWRPRFPREMLWYLQMWRNARREAEILHENRYFTGRTPWDRALLMQFNPAARYFSDGARLLRPEFYGPQWRLEACTRQRIYTTITARPYKGTDVLIEALRLLLPRCPAATLRIGGHLPEHGYGAYLRHRIRKLGLSDRVELIGFVNAGQIIRELRAAHAFVNSAYIENSPNSVAEAQRIGTPCIATAVGGTPSMVEDGVSGMLFPAGDARALAERLGRLFADDELARALSEGERGRSAANRDPDSLVRQLVGIYQQVLGLTAEDNAQRR